MKMKNALLVALPVGVSSCVTKPPVSYWDKNCNDYHENLKKQLEEFKQNFKNASGGKLSDFIGFEEQMIDKAKKSENRVKDEDGKKFLKYFSETNNLQSLQGQFGNLGTAMFVDSNLKFFLNPVYQKNEDKDTNTIENFVNNFSQKREAINKCITDESDSITVSLFNVRDLKFDDLSKIFDLDYKCQDLDEWFKLFSLCGYYSVENLLLPVEFKDNNGKNIGKGFVCDGFNCIQWGLIFEKNVSAELQEKCFNQMKEIFKKVVFKDKTIISKKIRFFCNEKSIWDKLSAFYKESAAGMFGLKHFRDCCKGFSPCFCFLGDDLFYERFLDFGYPCVGFDQRHGLYCCDFRGSIKN